MKDLLPRACVVVKTSKIGSLSNNDGNGNENKYLGNGDHFEIAYPSHPLLLTGHAANGLVKAPLK